MQAFGNQPDDSFNQNRANGVKFLLSRFFSYQGETIQFSIVVLLELADEIVDAVVKLVAVGGIFYSGGEDENAAGEGAKMALLSREARGEAQRIARRVRFVELASRSDFQERFVEALAFPAPGEKTGKLASTSTV